MAPAFKVTYFNFTGLGEPVRFLLSYGGLEFEDVRIEDEEWPAVKQGMPFGKVPVLEYKGKMADQSIAICRYVAKQVKLVGKDDWENLEIDATVETINDLRMKFSSYHYEADPVVKKSMGALLFNETVPFYMEKLDAQAKKNNGYLAIGQLTWADIFFVSYLDYLNMIAGKDVLTGYPNLQVVSEHVVVIPNIKTWLEKRPKNTRTHVLFNPPK